jgi:hypothetical protein
MWDQLKVAEEGWSRAEYEQVEVANILNLATVDITRITAHQTSKVQLDTRQLKQSEILNWNTIPTIIFSSHQLIFHIKAASSETLPNNINPAIMKTS